MYRILMIEDDTVICQQVTKHLEQWGYTVEKVTDFRNVLDTFLRFKPQLVLMDIGLPFFNGYHWCSEIRKHSKVPIVFLSSASDDMNVVMAMHMGGDDFINKPFNLEVLLAKIQAILRRTYAFQESSVILDYEGVLLNIGDMSITYGGNRMILTKNEVRMLQVLFENQGQVVTRERLMKKLWDSDCFIDDNTLSVNMNRLRKKLQEMGICDLIVTRKGVGYIVGGE